jgi:ubiquinone/menaquinone biosynthesis C-methylase UbiE
VKSPDSARPRFARMYMRSARHAEERGATDHRRRLLDGLSGTVVEVGAGHGLNFPHYPPEVTELIAVEPEPTLRAQAEAAAKGARVPTRVVAGVADQLPLEDASADAAVTSLVLCSVPDQQQALAEIRRVLRPDGELRFYEHVDARCQPKRLLFHVLDSSRIWPTISGGCHLARDTTEAIMQAGFDIEEIERFGFAAERYQPQIPHILGRARASVYLRRDEVSATACRQAEGAVSCYAWWGTQ